MPHKMLNFLSGRNFFGQKTDDVKYNIFINIIRFYWLKTSDYIRQFEEMFQGFLRDRASFKASVYEW